MNAASSSIGLPPSSSLELSTSLYAVRRFVSNAIPARPLPLLLARSYFAPMIFRPLFFSPINHRTVYCVIIIPIYVVASLLSTRAPVVVHNHRIGDGR